MKPQLLGRSFQIISLLVFLIVGCDQPAPPPSTGGPSFTINSPLENSSIGGTTFFSVQPQDPGSVASVAFKAGGKDLGTDTTATNGFKVFLNSKDYPAGALTLEAKTTGTDGKTNTKTMTVQNVLTPPSSGTVSTQGVVLGTTESNGSVSTLTIPPGVADGANVSFTSKTQAEVKASTGVDYDALGVTFLGAQEINSSQALNTPLGVTSGGYAPKVQPGQAVVNYRIAPDADGDGKGELVVVNTASVTPGGDVISDPVPQIQLGQVVLKSREKVTKINSVTEQTLSGMPGTLIEISASGFNPYSSQGNIATFRSVASGAELSMPVFVLPDFNNSSAQIVTLIIPPLPPGSTVLNLKNSSTGSQINNINVNIEALPLGNLSGALDRINDSLTRLISDLTVLRDSINIPVLEIRKQYRDLVSNAIAPITRTRFRFSQFALVLQTIPAGEAHDKINQMMAELAAVLDNLPTQALKQQRGGSLASAGGLGAAGSIVYAVGEFLGGSIFLNIITFPFLFPPAVVAAGASLVAAAPYIAGVGIALGALAGFCYFTDICFTPDPPPTCTNSATSNTRQTCTPPPPCQPTAGAGAGNVTGMGSAPPPGGNGCGSAAGGSSGGGAASSSLGLRQGRSLFAPEPGRYVIKIYTNNNPGPFTGVTDAGGYFFVPFIPAGQPFKAVAVDRITGEKRIFEGTGPNTGKSVNMFFDFTPPNRAPIADAGNNQSVAVSTSVNLSASTSSDPDSDPLTYQWELTSKPTGSAASLSNPSTVNPSLTPDVAGDYVATVTISDGGLTNTDTVTISATSGGGNRAPLAVAGNSQSVSAGATVTLNGSGSSDPDGNALSFQWVLTSKPSGSTAVLSSLTTASTTFVADKTGQYQASLSASDGSLSNTDTVTITATGVNQVVWDGGGDGSNWNNAQNWAGDVPPQIGDRVVIDVTGTPSITYSSGDTLIQSLECAETLVILGGNLEVNLASNIATLNLQNGTLGGSGNLSIGSMTWVGGILKGNAGTTATVNTSLTFTANSKTLDARHLINKGNATHNGGTLFFKTGAVLTNDVGAVFTDNHVGKQEVFSWSSTVVGSRVVNAGTINIAPTPDVNGGLESLWYVPFTNTGTLNVNAGLFRLQTEDGTTAIDLELAGTQNIASGATMQIENGANTITGALNGTGTGLFKMQGGNTTLANGSSFNVPNTLIAGGTSSFNTGSSINFPSLILNGGTLNGADNFSITNLTWTNGTLGGVIGTTATLTGTGTFNTGSRTLNTRSLTNKGTITNLDGALYFVNSAIFNNDVGATFTDNHVGKQEVFTWSSTIVGSRIINAGTINSSPTPDVNGGLESYWYVPFTNTGTLNVNAGLFKLQTEDGTAAIDLELAGIQNVANGATLQIVNGTNNISGTVNGSGTGLFKVEGGNTTLTSGMSFNVPNTLITSGTLTANTGSSLSFPSLIFNGGTLTGTDNFSIINLTWTNGTLGGVIGTTATLTGTGTFNTGSRTLNTRSLINKGTITNLDGTLFFVDSAIFTNDVGATFTDNHVGKKTVFSWSSTVVGSRIINAGTINSSPTADVNGGLESLWYVPFANTGTLNVNAGLFRLQTEDGTAAIDLELAGTQNIASGATMQIENGANTITGALNGTGTGLFKMQGGNTTLASGAVINVSETLMTSGTFNGGGTVTGNVSLTGGVLNIDANGIGTLTINGNYTQGASASLKIDLDTGGQKDSLNVTGTSALAGTLTINRLNNFIPAVSDSFQVITAGSVSGTFSSVQNALITTGRSFQVVYNPTNVTLTVP